MFSRLHTKIRMNEWIIINGINNLQELAFSSKLTRIIKIIYISNRKSWVQIRGKLTESFDIKVALRHCEEVARYMLDKEERKK